MNKKQASDLIQKTFPEAFDKGRFRNFAINVLNRLDESKAQQWSTQYVKDAFKGHVKRYERLGTYTSPDKETLDVLIVYLTGESKLERARTAIRNFVADHLKKRDEKDAALVAFVSPTEMQWRFSYVKMEYATIEKESGKIGVETRLTPARRFSYLVGEGESCHTAQTRFLGLLQDTDNNPTLAQIEEAFSVEAVTKEFFAKYAELFSDITTALDKLVKKDRILRDEFKAKGVNTVDFAKKLMGQIVFLYFLQKKGWLGVEKGKDWGTGPCDFLRRLADGYHCKYNNFFNDILEPLFYDTLATDRGHEAWCNRFKCRIPFLNGGLFEPLGGYDWKKTDIILPNRLFRNNDFVEEGITGTGVLDVFDRYNFTVNEAEPLEIEVAIDPEMLGKVFENLIEENRRKGLGSYYTPREIVHYMCQETLINYLDTAVNTAPESLIPQKAKQAKLFGDPEPEQTALKTTVRRGVIPRAEIETFVRLGEQISHYEAVDTKYAIKMPKSIKKNAKALDDALKTITVCDPAVGSGAFPVGMMTEIIRSRAALTPYFNDVEERTPYHFKRHAIQNCLYGVDIDSSAVEIARLRLWLSLVVDEEDVKQVKPLPNLDYKIVVGNSLLGVEKNLFNNEQFKQLENLKPKFFDETDREKKAQIKGQIETLIHDLTSGRETFDFEIYFSEIFHANKGFDVVIANPPYLNLTVNSYDSALLSAYNRIFSVFRGAQSKNLFAPFVERGIGILSGSGVISYIVPEGLTNTRSYKPVRKLFVTNAHLTSLLIFDEFVFEKVVIGNVVFVASQAIKGKVSINKMRKGGAVELLKLIDNLEINASPILEWKTRESTNNLTRKIAQVGYELGTRFSMSKGMVVKDRQKHLRSRRTRNSELPFILGKNMNRYQLWYDSYTTYRELKIVGGTKVLAKHVAVPRLLIRRTGDSVCATYSATPELVESTLYIMTGRNEDNLKVVLGLLNSKLMTYYVRQSFITNQQAFPQIVMSNLLRLPIALPNSEQIKQIVCIVDQILSAKRRDPGADTTAMEQEIDRLVYTLYGITPEDIEIVEGGA